MEFREQSAEYRVQRKLVRQIYSIQSRLKEHFSSEVGGRKEEVGSLFCVLIIAYRAGSISTNTIYFLPPPSYFLPDLVFPFIDHD